MEPSWNYTLLTTESWKTTNFVLPDSGLDELHTIKFENIKDVYLFTSQGFAVESDIGSRQAE